MVAMSCPRDFMVLSERGEPMYILGTVEPPVFIPQESIERIVSLWT